MSDVQQLLDTFGFSSKGPSGTPPPALEQQKGHVDDLLKTFGFEAAPAQRSAAPENPLALSSDPLGEAAKVQAARVLAPALGTSPADVVSNWGTYTKHLYGSEQKPATVWDRVRNTINDFKVSTERAAIGTKRMFGTATAADLERDKELAAEQRKPTEQLPDIPKAILQSVMGLGYLAGTGAGTLADWAAATVTGGMFNTPLSQRFEAMAQEEQAKFLGNFTGGMYSQLRDQGHSVQFSRAAAGIYGAVQTALFGLPVSKIPGVQKLLGEAVNEVAARMALDGSADGIIQRAVAGEVPQAVRGVTATIAARYGARLGEIGAYNVAASTIATMTPILADTIDRKAKQQGVTDQTVGEIMKQIFGSAAGATIGMGILGIPAALREGSALRGALDQTVESLRRTPSNEEGGPPQTPTEAGKSTGEHLVREPEAIKAEAEAQKKPIEEAFKTEEGQAIPIEGSQDVGGEMGVVPRSNVNNEALAYESYKSGQVPEGWYVHGRVDQGALREDAPIEMSTDWNVAEQYAGKKGSMFMLRPKNPAEVFDTRGEEASKLADRFFEDFEAGRLPSDGLNETARFMIENARGDIEKAKHIFVNELNPKNIVESAGLWDANRQDAFPEWFYETTGKGFVITADGAVAIHPDFVESVKVPTERPLGASIAQPISSLVAGIEDQITKFSKQQAAGKPVPEDQLAVESEPTPAEEYPSGYLELTPQERSMVRPEDFAAFQKAMDVTGLKDVVQRAQRESPSVSQEWPAMLEDFLRRADDPRFIEGLIGDIGIKVQKGDRVHPIIYSNALRVAHGSHITDTSFKILRGMLRKDPLSWMLMEASWAGDQQLGRTIWEAYQRYVQKPEGNTPQEAAAKESVLSGVRNRITALEDALKSARQEAKAQGKDRAAALEDALKSARQEYGLAVKNVKAETKARAEAKFAAREANRKVREETTRLLTSIRRMKRSFETTYKGMPEQITAPLQRIFETFREGNPSQRTLEGLNGLREAIQQHPEASFSEEALAQLSELDKTPFAQLPIGQLRGIHDAIAHYMKIAREAEQVRVGNEMVNKQIAIGNSLAEIGKTAKKIKTRESTDARFGERIKVMTDSMVAGARSGVYSYDALVNFVGGGERSTFYDVLGRQMDEGTNLQNKLAEHEYPKPIQDWFDKNNQRITRWLSETKDYETGDGRRVTVSRRHKLSLWGIAQQQGGLESFYNGAVMPRSGRPYEIRQFPPEFFRNVLEDITPQERDFLENGFNQMTERAFKDTAEAHLDVNGRYPTKVEGFYYPLYRVRTMVGGAVSPRDLMEQQLGRNRIAVDKSRLIERVDSTAPVYWRGIDEDIADIIDFSSRYTAFARTAKNAWRVLGNKEVEQAMLDRFGSPKVMNALRDGFAQILGNKKPMYGIERFLENMRGLGVNLILAFRATTGVINAALGLRASQYVPYGDVFLGSMNGVLHPLSTARLLKNITQMYDEMSTHGGDYAQEAALGAPSRIVRGISRVSMVPITMGVKTAAVMEMSGAIHQALREFKLGKLSEPLKSATGLTDEQAKALPMEDRMEAAGKYADYVTKRTHAVPRPQFRAGITRQGFVGRWAMTLGSEMNAGLNMIIRGIHERKTPGGYRRLVKAMIVMAVAEPFVVGLIHRNSLPYLLGQKKQKKTFAETMTSEEIMQIAGGLPFGGDIAYGIEGAAQGRKVSGVLNGVQGEYADNIVNLAGQAWRVLAAKNSQERASLGDKFVQDFLSSMTGRKIGLPVLMTGNDPTGEVAGGGP